MKFEMDTIQLSRILSNMPVKGEACAKDLLPDRKPLHTKAYIVNTDLSDDPGEIHGVKRVKCGVSISSINLTEDKICKQLFTRN